MKTALLILLLAAASFADELPKIPQWNKTSASLDVKNVAGGKTTNTSYSDGYGGYDKTFMRSRTLDISIHNFNRTDAFTGDIRLYWLGRRGPSGGARVVVGEPRLLALNIPSGRTTYTNADSGMVTARDLKLPLIGYRSTGGMKLDAWLVVLYDQTGATTAIKSSSPAIEEEYRRGELSSVLPAWKALPAVEAKITPVAPKGSRPIVPAPTK